MIRFDQKFIDELLAKLNIVDVIGGYCQLQRKGGSYWACCPLPGHSERTPSFAVNESGQFYKCFGCGRGGNAIKFVMEMESMDFPDAVALLCEKAHIPLPEDDGSYQAEQDSKKKQADKNRLYELMRDTALFYVDSLKGAGAQKHRAYLQKRGLDKSQITVFGLGASPDYDSLVKHLDKKGYTRDEMVQSGAVQYKKESNKYFDAIGGRLVFPIIDSMNHVIAFGGRVLEKTDFAKYKNTGDTPIFNKRKTLYNINNLKKEKALKGKLDYVIIVEGYMDTIALHKAGFKNVVASMGTSLTTEQARLLKRYADLVLICYDGDSAGQNATVRGLEILKENGLEVRIVSLPDGLDPDELIAERGRSAYEKCLSDALPLIDFKLERVKNSSDQDSLGGKRKYIEESLQVIAKCESVSLQEELLKKLRDESGLTYESLYRDLEKLKNGDLPKGQATIVQNIPNQFNGTKLEIAERFLLCSFIKGESYAQGNLEDFTFSDKFRDELAQFVGAKILLKKAVEQDKLKDFAGDENLAELLKILGAIEEVDESSREQYFIDCKKTLLTNSIKLKIEKLRAEYTSQTDREKRSQIATELNALTIKLTKLK